MNTFIISSKAYSQCSRIINLDLPLRGNVKQSYRRLCDFLTLGPLDRFWILVSISEDSRQRRVKVDNNFSPVRQLVRRSRPVANGLAKVEASASAGVFLISRFRDEVFAMRHALCALRVLSIEGDHDFLSDPPAHSQPCGSMAHNQSPLTIVVDDF